MNIDCISDNLGFCFFSLAQAFCRAIGHRVTDKCHPTPLADGAFSTQTAKLLRDSFRPLQSLLTMLDEKKVNKTYNGKKCSPLRRYDVYIYDIGYIVFCLGNKPACES